MKFLSSRKNLFTISESPVDDPAFYSSSFTAGSSPQKPTQRKTRRGRKKSTVQKSLAHALSMVAQKSSRSITKSSSSKDNNDDYYDANSDSFEGTLALKDSGIVGANASNNVSLESSQNSINTCSTASLTDDDSNSDDVHNERPVAKEQHPLHLLLHEQIRSGSQRKKQKSPRHNKKKKSKGTDLLLPKEPPLIRGEVRWGEASKLELMGEEQHYRSVRRMSRDVAPICPVRTRE
eukprot:CAMPEP_0197189180 /NCGR_PEP_ID=MMETSP1423-20130617/19299_1 /TAXON_ID=476441 /ORGANISM="Pseudo-nitzschia heimii, Strain UNC1101" /LENGTH=234 /DNA_ID=CAMNT_0042641229 /DNA_START=84 /DNA_END=788 /DNA_ORIENTATION=-